MSIQTVGIIGAGTMGSGIAQACAVAGVRVVMVDIAEAAVAKGLASVDSSLERLLKKDKISQADKDAALARIRTSTQYEDLKSADLVIEASLKSYDWAALEPVIAGAGGSLTDWQGRPLDLAAPSVRVLAAGDPALRDAAIARLAG